MPAFTSVPSWLYRKRGTMTDLDAVTLAKQGSEDAFQELYRRHLAVVRGRCIKALSNDADAEDCTQEIFLKVWLKLNNFRGDCLFSTWLHILTTNQICDRMRDRHYRLPVCDIENISDIPTAPQQLLRVQISDALSRLSDEDEAYIQASVGGYTPREIAIKSRRTAGTVHKHLQRSRTRIRKLL